MTATAPPARPAGQEPLPPPVLQRPLGYRILEPLGSMKLTVVLLLALAILTLAGTFAQIDRGLFDVQREYFESFYVLIDTKIAIGPLTIKVPFPGAYPLMVLLAANLLVGGLWRLKWGWRNAGIAVTHIGMLLLLVAGFVKLHWSYSGHVSLYEGKATQAMVSFHDYELVLLRVDGDRLVERTVPEAELAGAKKGTVTLSASDLPFTVRVERWLDNCQPMPKGPMFQAPTPVVEDGRGPGVFLQPEQLAKEREANTAGCYVTVVEGQSGREQQGILWGWEWRPRDHKRYPFTFEVSGQTWGLDLRRVVWDLPFAVRLDRFEKRDHPGTMTPRDFSSWVSVVDGAAERQAHIYMNNPLRKDGYVFFQTSWGPSPESGMKAPPFFSVFEVARNPSDKWPEWASYVILAGLLLHFLMKLYRYLGSGNYRASVS